MSSGFDILSIGHSNHSQEKFVGLLKACAVDAVADVRSSPYSRFTPHFSQSEIKRWLREHGIAYVFLGKELGGRPGNPALFQQGVADYEAMAKTPEFSAGLARLIKGAENHLVATMCSEHDPLDCHRCLLVARRLAEKGVRVGHILQNGEVVSQEQTEERLLKLEGLSADDLFFSRSERLANAYRQRGMSAAFAETAPAVSAG